MSSCSVIACYLHCVHCQFGLHSRRRRLEKKKTREEEDSRRRRLEKKKTHKHYRQDKHTSSASRTLWQHMKNSVTGIFVCMPESEETTKGDFAARTCQEDKYVLEKGLQERLQERLQCKKIWLLHSRRGFTFLSFLVCIMLENRYSVV